MTPRPPCPGPHPADGGSPITSYTVTPYIGTTAQTAKTVTGTPPATSTTVTGLTNGTAYTFKVTATNAVGTSPASAASNSITRRAAASRAAPTGVTATAGDASATVSWTAPPNGGSADHRLHRHPVHRDDRPDPHHRHRHPTGDQHHGDRAHQRHRLHLQVTATNTVGTGPASATSNTVTPFRLGGVHHLAVLGHPEDRHSTDTSSTEVGVKFTSDVNGQVTGIRFYKGTGNTGTHVGNLWTLSGTRLATVTFTDETASGWQQADFTTPVTITAGTVYVASYLAPVGRYATDRATSIRGVDSPPLHALKSGASGGNGVFSSGATSTFPTSTSKATNYWVDVIFRTL